MLLISVILLMVSVIAPNEDFGEVIFGLFAFLRLRDDLIFFHDLDAEAVEDVGDDDGSE